MQNNAGLVDHKKFFFFIWHWLWLILLLGIISGGVAYYLSGKISPVYETSTRILVLEASSNRPADYQDLLTSERLTRTYSAMMTNESVLQEVIENLSLPVTAEDLAESIEVLPVRDTQLIEIIVEGEVPQQIADIANNLVTVFLERINSIQSDRYSNSIESLQSQMRNIENIMNGIQTQIEGLDTQIAAQNVAEVNNNVQDLLSQKENLEIQLVQYQQIFADLLTNFEQTRLAETQSNANIISVNTALPPEEPIRPNPLLNALIAASAAGLLSIGALFIGNFLNDTIDSPEQVEGILGLPVLGLIFQHRTGIKVISQENPLSPISEAFRTLRTNVDFYHENKGFTTFLITSAELGSGKSLVSNNLAVILAQNAKKVVLVDVDLRRPSVHKNFSLNNDDGLTSYLLDKQIKKESIINPTESNGLNVITSGDLPQNPSELLSSKRMTDLIAELTRESDIVIFDAPPVMPVADSVVLSTKVDAVLLVLKPGETSVAAARQTVRSLERVGANIIGVVLNGIKTKGSLYSQYYRSSYGEYFSAYREGK